MGSVLYDMPATATRASLGRPLLVLYPTSVHRGKGFPLAGPTKKRALSPAIVNL
jgi:hypothetical protein